MNIYAVGWNYAAHNLEMGRQERPDLVIFQKSLGSVAQPSSTRPSGLTEFRLAHPGPPHELSYEGELIVLIGRGGSGIPPERAARHIAGYGVGLDMTLRDVQREARAQGKPWFAAKNFPGATVVAPLAPSGSQENILVASLTLKVNGEIRQHAMLSEMLNSPAQIISMLSSRVVLFPGDLIFTGTPAGTGCVYPGDVVDLEVTGLPRLRAVVY
jgi:fumarylpyruvate hydrolase